MKCNLEHKKSLYSYLFLITITSHVFSVFGLNNGVALKPPMGWMSWGYYKCSIQCQKPSDRCLDENLIMYVADSMYSHGYLEAGYEYIIIDDCWSERERKKGKLVPDRKRFPNGMKFLADYIHSKGLKLGLYTTVGDKTCAGFPGSLHHYGIDAKTFAKWGIDYLKVDGCFTKEHILDNGYMKLGHSLNATKRPIVYGCSWPYYKYLDYKKKTDMNVLSKTCNLWRIYHDIEPEWKRARLIIDYFQKLVPEMTKHHGPGHWYDPDMLLVGTNVLTAGQARIQMVVYSMMSAPLTISCDMTNVTASERDLLQNPYLIALAQDPFGKPAVPYVIGKPNSELKLYIKHHSPKEGQTYSCTLGIVNFGKKAASVKIPVKYCVVDESDEFKVFNVFKEKFQKNVTSTDFIVAKVPSEDVTVYTLYPI